MEEFLFVSAGICLVFGVVAIVPMLTTRRRWFAAVSFIVGIVLLSDAFYRLATRDRTTPENVESKITGWLRTFYLGAWKMQDDLALFNYKVEANIIKNPKAKPSSNDEDTFVMNVARPKDLPQYIVFGTNVRETKEQLEFFKKLPVEQKEEVLIELRKALAIAKTGYDLERCCPRANVYRKVPITSLEEANFVQQLDEVYFAATLFTDTLDLALRSRGMHPKPLVEASPTPNTATSPH